MTSPDNPHPRRLFKVGEQTFPDPGPAYRPADVLQHLRTFLPELGQATTSERTLADGTLEITFSKQVTRKGSA